MAEKDVVTDAVVAAKAGNPAVVTDDNPQGASDWTKDFDDDLKKKVERFKGGPKELAKAYVELETYQSKAFQDMTPDQQEKYLKRLGLPESAEEYELSSIVLPDKHERPATAAAEFRTLMKSLNLTKDQGKRLDEWMMKRAADNITAASAAAKRQAEEREAALRTSWGAAYDGNGANVEKLIRLGGDQFVQAMNAGPVKEPAIREGLYAISKLFADDTLVSGKVDRKSKETRPDLLFDPSMAPELLT
jgi:hypothetical protein